MLDITWYETPQCFCLRNTYTKTWKDSCEVVCVQDGMHGSYTCMHVCIYIRNVLKTWESCPLVTKVSMVQGIGNK